MRPGSTVSTAGLRGADWRHWSAGFPITELVTHHGDTCADFAPPSTSRCGGHRHGSPCTGTYLPPLPLPRHFRQPWAASRTDLGQPSSGLPSLIRLIHRPAQRRLVPLRRIPSATHTDADRCYCNLRLCGCSRVWESLHAWASVVCTASRCGDLSLWCCVSSSCCDPFTTGITHFALFSNAYMCCYKPK